MSFKKLKNVVEENDTVVLFFRVDYLLLVEITKYKLSKKAGEKTENIYQSPYGAIRPMDLVGKQYGSIYRFGTGGWAHILQPTADLWSKTLPHRTQIIYGPDISMILLYLGLKPNSIVVEAGTGSGSVSHAFVNSVKPHGKLYTFDYHEDRVALAKEEFQRHGIDPWVECRKSDVFNEGFPGIEPGIVDGVFLDLPQPWLALPFTLKILKTSGSRIVCFSPCIEQVQTTVSKLTELGFYDINTIEILQTAYNVYRRMEPSLNLTPLCQPKYEGSTDLGAVVTDKGLMHRPMSKKQTGHSGYLTSASYCEGIFADNDDSEN